MTDFDKGLITDEFLSFKRTQGPSNADIKKWIAEKAKEHGMFPLIMADLILDQMKMRNALLS